MMSRSRCFMLSWLTAGLATSAVMAQQSVTRPFESDEADRTAEAVILGGEEEYEADLAAAPDGLWVAWLEFVPGEGDHLFLGLLRDGEFVSRTCLTEAPGKLANPRLTVAADGGLWLSHEVATDGRWDVVMARRDDDGGFSRFRRLPGGGGPNIHHRAAAAPDGAVWVVWQSARDGEFAVLAARVDRDGVSEPMLLSEGRLRGNWHPHVATAPDGTVYVVWDGYDGESYNVFTRIRRDGAWGRIIQVTDRPAFEGRAQVAVGQDGRAWMLWEEGAENWGKYYTPEHRKYTRTFSRMTDAHGPLHRFRLLRLARLDADGAVRRFAEPLPMPSIETARQRPDAPEGISTTGAFYERGRLVFDSGGRLWVLYRHYYIPWLGIEVVSHQDDGWGVYARPIDEDGWSASYQFTIGQGDGMQSLSAVPDGDGIAAVWTTGRTDRRELDRPRGIAFGRIRAPGRGPAGMNTRAPVPAIGPERLEADASAAPSATVNGETLYLFHGDLHRHTDLSLCFVPTDGTMDDAYRYALDVVRYDFMGITDHSRDIARGNVLSQLWWRNVKEVTRHNLRPRFIPYFAYERSRGGDDHNVISLRSDMLRPHTYPHPRLWRELDDDTITIPHQTWTEPLVEGEPKPPSLRPETWDQHDEMRRPLLEIYQGCRDRAIEHDAQVGLARERIFGFIASSDHMSTSGSFASVWAPERTREAIFRAMQARRTFGATARMRLLVTSGDRWMGERFAAEAFGPVKIELDGTAPVSSVEVLLDGGVAEQWSPGRREVRLEWTPPALPPGLHYLYVRVRQADGHRAWSSPIWVEISRAPPAGGDGTE